MTIICTHVDAFTCKPYTGNPACIVVLDETSGRDIHDDTEWMQNVAMEMNLSETSFLSSIDGDSNHYHLRWFTPNTEVDLCGHATLAAAHNLWERKLAQDREIRFETKSGALITTRELLNGKNTITLNFPVEAAHPVDASDPGYDKVAKGFGIDENDILFRGRNRMDFFIEVTPSSFGKIKPNLSVIAEIECRLVCITAAATSESLDNGASKDIAYDFVSRGFAPRCGINEDPVTGSTHCALGPYWSQKICKDDLCEFNARVASQRGGDLKVTVRDHRVYLGGEAVTTMVGELRH